MYQLLATVGAAPAGAPGTGFTGCSRRNFGSMFFPLKPIGERK